MSEVTIITDSTCDLSKEVLNQYQIKVVPLYVIFENDKYKDSVDIKTDKLYEEVTKRGILPKTSPPTVSNFIEIFQSVIEKGNDVVYIGISSKLSLTIQSATLASNEFPTGRIHIVDSLSASTGMGLLALKAAKYAQDGIEAKFIAERIRKLVPKVETHFILDTLEYLHMGGRCSGLTNFMSSLLKIKPILKVKNGELEVVHKPMGKSKAFDILLEKIYEDQYIIDEDLVIIIHSLDNEGVLYLKNGIKSNTEIKNLMVENVGCVISSHCGKGAIGITYISG